MRATLLNLLFITMVLFSCKKEKEDLKVEIIPPISSNISAPELIKYFLVFDFIT